MPIRHKYQSTKADSGDNTLLGPTAWNDSHSVTLTVAAKSANYTITSTDEVILATGGTTGIILPLPDATTVAGFKFIIKKVDSGAGAVDVNTVNAQTIDSLYTSYALTVQNQFIKLVSDGANYQIIGNN